MFREDRPGKERKIIIKDGKIYKNTLK